MKSFLFLFMFLFCFCCASRGAEGDVPSSASRLSESFNREYDEVGARITADYRAKLQALLQKCIAMSDIDLARQIKDELENTAKDPHFLMKASACAFTGRWNEERLNIKHWVDAEGTHYQIRGNGQEMTTNESVDTAKSSSEILVFTGNYHRVWLLYGDQSVAQFCGNSFSTLQRIEDENERQKSRGIEESSPLTSLRCEYVEKYNRQCVPLQEKYIQDLLQIQEKESQAGHGDQALKLHTYIESLKKAWGIRFEGAGKPGFSWPDKRLLGTWKEKSGWSYQFDNKGNLVVKNAQDKYVRAYAYQKSSPAGDLHFFQHRVMGTLIAGVADGNVHMFTPGASGWHATATKCLD